MKMQVKLLFDAEDQMDGDAIVKAVVATLATHGVKATPVNLEEAPAHVLVHTDGGCDRNKDGIGAWAFTAQTPEGKYFEEVGTEWETTNNRMELMALIKALETLEIGPAIKVVADSEYVVKGITVWCRNWVRNGWKTASGSPVINKDLWERLIGLHQVHDVTFELVKGHTGHEGNERCDELCTQAMQMALKQFVAGHQASLVPDLEGPL